MRLRLTIERQELPPAHILWNAGGLRQGFNGNAATTTIAQLLEEVNEVIPLEADEWGLEDYAVEVNGFECLHFCTLAQVLKEDDSIRIRPLQTSDLRYRRISGRHQISVDGRHLKDGVSFGRPFLRRTYRPQVRIPARKRARLLHDDDDDSDTAVNENQQSVLVPQTLTGGFEGGHDNEDIEGAELEDSEANGSKGSSEEPGQELRDFSQDTHALNAHRELRSHRSRHRRPLEITEPPLSRKRKRERRHSGFVGGGLSTALSNDGPKSSSNAINPLTDGYYQDKPAAKAYKLQAFRAGTGSRSLRADSSIPTDAAQRRIEDRNTSRRSSAASTKNVRFENSIEDGRETPATIPQAEASESSDDDFDPDQEFNSDSSESNKENVEPRGVEGSENDPDESDDADLSAISRSVSTSSVSTSSSGASSSGSDSSDACSSTSSSGTSSSDSSSDSDKEDTLKSSSAQTTRSPPKLAEASRITTHTPPGQGLDKTKIRNQRRRIRKRFQSLQSIGVLASNATLADYEQWAKDQNDTVDLGKSQAADSNPFEARRQALLESISGGGVEVDSEPGVPAPRSASAMERSVPEDQGSTNISKPAKADVLSMAESTSEQNTDHGKRTLESPSLVSVPASGQCETGKSRTRLDLASSRRLVFGSLGLRAPVTKAEEEKMRKKLMGKVKPTMQTQIEEHPESKNSFRGSGYDDNAWRDKIVLKAVECCQDGVELSTPPFPFVQRWDPQQRSSHNGRTASGGRGKKRKRDHERYYESHQHDETQDFDYGTMYDEPTEPEVPASSTGNQVLRDTNVENPMLPHDKEPMEDLPALPANATTLPTLVAANATLGAIVAFKQLEMSEFTNWQPLLSDYRTAEISAVREGGLLQLKLAKRDIPTDRKRYDPDTGERIYSKFEMPDMEDDECSDEGYLELSIVDLIDPKLVLSGLCSANAPEESPPAARGELSEETCEPGLRGDSTTDIVAVERPSQIRSSPSSGFGTVVIGMGDPNGNQETIKTTNASSNTVGSPLDPHVRQEISLLIQDAGFRMDIDVGMAQGLDGHVCSTTDGSEGPGSGKTLLSAPFHGFSSGSPKGKSSTRTINASSDHTANPESHTVLSHQTHEEGRSPSFNASMNVNEQSLVPPPETADDEASASGRDDIVSPENELAVSQEISRRLEEACVSGPEKQSSLISSASVDEDDNDEFPSLEYIFSQSYAQVETNHVEEDKALVGQALNDANGKASCQSKVNVEGPDSPPSEEGVHDVTASQQSAYSAALKSSQASTKTRVVDLTISSSPTDLDASEYLEPRSSMSNLPKGPGWVKKTRKIRRRGAQRMKSTV